LAFSVLALAIRKRPTALRNLKSTCSN
jgi:hypothetical protein